jgi:hypothetical protein
MYGKWRAIGLAIAVVAFTQVTMACGGGSSGPGVAAGGTPSSSSTASGRQSALAYSQCMRAHGIKDFPDPGSDGGITLNAGPGSDLDQHNPQYQIASSACAQLLPPERHPNVQQLKTANLNYAKCMRAHGISDFPDPKPDGTLQIKADPGSDLDPSNPQFKAADNACKHYEPGGGQGGGTVTNSGGRS